MKITIDNNRFMELQAAPDDLKMIDKFFTFQDFSECFVYGKFKKENIKIVKYLINDKKYPTVALLPIGFKDELHRWLHLHNAKYKFYEKRSISEYNFTDDEIRNVLFNENNNIILRDYQISAVKTLLSSTQGICKAGTGAGKSEILAAWVKLTNVQTLILFKNIKLARELHERLSKANIDCGLVQGNNVDENHKVIMATVQSAHKLKRTDYVAVIADECHNCSQERYQMILNSSMFKYRFGFSATPFNAKNKFKNSKIKSWLGNIIINIPAIKLINEGHLARPIITFIKINKTINNVKRQKIIKTKDEYGNIKKEKEILHDETEKDISEYNWANAEKAGIVNNIYRNKIIQDLANSLPGTVLALVKYVDSHGEKLHKTIDNALFLSGKNKIEERELAVDMLENNKIKTIIASTIFDEGVSINNIYNVILCGGGQSYEKTLQRIGRGMRKHVDEKGIEKEGVVVYDFYDETHPILERHSKERIKYCKNEGYDVEIKDLNSIDF